MVRTARNKRGKNKGGNGSKVYDAWVSLRHIKDTTGLPIKELHFILEKKNLWKGMRPSSQAIEIRIARYNQHLQKYEWRNDAVIRLLNRYIKEGTRSSHREQLQPKDSNESTADVTSGI